MRPRKILVTGGTSGIGAGIARTFFNIAGAMVCVDEGGRPSGYEDVFTKIETCRRHYEACGFGGACVEQCVR